MKGLSIFRRSRLGRLLGTPLLIALLVTGAGTGQLTASTDVESPAPALPPQQADYTMDLWAREGTITLPGSAIVPIWGFSTTQGGTAELPGPVLEVVEGDLVEITLHNELVGADVSLVFPGQEMIPDFAGVAPGGMKTYTFIAGRPGTFLYESGVNDQNQVSMGLYGALIVRPAADPQWAYDDAATQFDIEATLVVSEIDPALHQDPSGYDLFDYSPTHYLMNGKLHPDTDPIFTAPGQTVLVRFLNAGNANHAMTLLGLDQRVIGHEGYQVSFPYDTYSVNFVSGETYDVLVTVPGITDVVYPLYERGRTMHSYYSSTFPGGMMTVIAVGDITDIAVLDVTAPAESIQGETVDVEVTVENIGNQDVGADITVSLYDDTDSVAVGAPQTIAGGLAAGASTILTFSWDTAAASLGDHTLTASQDVADDVAANDSLSTVATVLAGLADIAIVGVAPPAESIQGETVDVDVTIENVGNQDVVADITVSLYDDTDAVAIGAPQTIAGGLAAGASTILTFSWDTTAASLGDHTLTANQGVADDVAVNDSLSTVAAVLAGLTDIAIVDVTAPAESIQGETVDVDVTVENVGNQDVVADITVSLYDDTGAVAIGAPQTIAGGLAAGASTILTFSWDTTAASLGDHTLTANQGVADDVAANDASSIVVTVTEPPVLSITSIEPDSMPIDSVQEVVITGTLFAPEAEVTLENGNGPAPDVAGIIVSPDGTTITATLTTSQGGPKQDRVWDVRVTNPDDSTVVLVDGFTVVVPAAGVAVDL